MSVNADTKLELHIFPFDRVIYNPQCTLNSGIRNTCTIYNVKRHKFLVGEREFNKNREKKNNILKAQLRTAIAEGLL